MNCTIRATDRVMSPCGRNSATYVVPATLPGMDGDYTPQEVAELLETTDVQLIDVRQPHEHEAGRIHGDRLIELMMLTSQVESIDRDRPVIFYCRTGARSAMATERSATPATTRTTWSVASCSGRPPGCRSTLRAATSR